MLQEEGQKEWGAANVQINQQRWRRSHQFLLVPQQPTLIDSALVCDLPYQSNLKDNRTTFSCSGTLYLPSSKSCEAGCVLTWLLVLNAHESPRLHPQAHLSSFLYWPGPSTWCMRVYMCVRAWNFVLLPYSLILLNACVHAYFRVFGLCSLSWHVSLWNA